MNRITILLFFLIAFTGLTRAEDVCKRTAVFFETDKSALTEAGTHKLDSLIAVMGSNEFLVELYGHTDTVGNTSYNEKLAASRIRAVREYISSKSKATLQFHEKNLTETNYSVSSSIEKNLAFNRCVDIFLVPVANGRLVLQGPGNSSVETPMDYFGDCGVCNSHPTIKAYSSGEEAAAANITLETTAGQPLVTAGMIDFNFTPCPGSGKTPKDPCIIYRVCFGVPACPVSMWTADTVGGKVYWNSVPGIAVIDTLKGCISSPCMDQPFVNFDCPGEGPGEPDTIGRLVLPKEFFYRHQTVYRENSVVQKSEKDSIQFGVPDSALVIRSIGKSGSDYYCLFAPIDTLPFVIRKEQASNQYVKLYSPTLASYERLEFSDTLLRVSFGKKAVPGQFGFYLPEYNEFIPIDSVSGKYYIGHKPKAHYQYAYLKGKKLYVQPEGEVKEKYQRRRKAIRVRFNGQQRGRFKKVKEFYSAPAR